MSDIQKPYILTILAVLALIIGVYSFIRGGLLIYNSIRQLSAGFGGIFELIIGLLSVAVGVLAFIGGISVVLNRPGFIDAMKRYAIAITAYQIVWVIFTIASGRMAGWGSVILDSMVGVGTYICIISNEDIKKYSVADGNSTVDSSA